MQNTNLTKSLTEHIQTNARGTNVPNNKKTLTNVTVRKKHKTVRKTRNKLTRRLIPNSARDTSVTKSQQNTSKTVHDTQM